MKSLHVGLLVMGAGVAGGLALKMTEIPPVTQLPAPQRVVSAPAPPPSVAPIPEKQQAKPSPIPQVAWVNGPTAVRATAPEPIYAEPPPKAAVHKAPPAAPPAPVHVAANVKPKQWIPGKYESSGDSSAAPRAAAKPAAAPAAATKPAATPAAAPLMVASLEKTPTPPVVPAIEQKPAPAPAPQQAPHQATLRPGMAIAIRIGETLSSNYSPTGRTFAGTLTEPLVADGFVIAERGARVSGRILDSEKAGRFTGTSRLQLGLTNVLTSDGQQVAIATEPWLRLGDTIPAETVVRFRLTSKVTITERQLDGK